MGEASEAKKNIVYVVAEGRYSAEALHWSLHTAKESHYALIVAYVGEDSAAQTKLQEIEKQCRTFQVPVQTQIEKGSYLAACERLGQIAAHEILVVVEKREAFLKNLFTGSEIASLKGRIGCELKVYS